MLYSLTLEISHGCVYSLFSQNFPEMEFKLWCKGTNDIMELKGNEDVLNQALKYVKREMGDIVNEYPDQNGVQLVLKLCDCSMLPFSKIYEKFNCIDIPPSHWKGGREIINLITTSEDADKIFEEMRKADPTVNLNIVNLIPLRKLDKDFPLYLPLEDLLKHLTEKQRQALMVAYTNGYYKIPRSIIMEDLAKKLQISRKTFEEHLRKAENKIINILLPAMMISQ